MVNYNNYNSYSQAKDIRSVSDIIGSWGIWQINVFIFQTIHASILPVFNHGIAFFDIDTNYYCFQYGNESSNFIETNIDELGFNQISCRLMSFDCEKFVYEYQFYENSLTKSFDLVCEKTWLRYLSSSFYQLGCLTSIFLYFLLCKKFGRTILIKFTLIIEIISNLFTLFNFNYYAYLSARFFLGLGSFGCFLLLFILLMEIISKNIRSEICILIQFGWTLGNLMFSLLLSFVVFDYLYLQKALLILQTFLFLWSFFLPESPKWQLLNGHYKKAEKTLIKAGKGFHKLSNYEIKGRLMLLRENLIEQEVNQKFNNLSHKKGKKIDLKLIYKTISLLFSWFVCKLIYFSISYYPELFTKTDGNFLQQNSIYLSLVEFFTFIITYLLIRFFKKRIYILVFALFFISISIYGELLFFKLHYFEDSLYNFYIKLTFLLIIKFGVSVVLQFLFIFTGECFNENLNLKIYGYTMGFGCLGAILASFFPLIINLYSLTYTLIGLGVLTIINLFIIIWMPELVQTSDLNIIQKLNINVNKINDLSLVENSFEFSFKIEE